MLLEREKVSEENRWNVGALFPSLEAWNKDFDLWKGEEISSKQPHKWPELSKCKGSLHQGPQKISYLLNIYFKLDRTLSKLYTYAHLKHDEDVANDTHKQAYLRISHLINHFREEASWIEPEILSLSQEALEAYLSSKELEEYKIFLKKIIRFKPHTLSSVEEALLAKSSIALDTTAQAFGAFNNADLKFPDVTNEKGENHPLSHGSYSIYMHASDRTLRKNTFFTLLKGFSSYENTLCELLSGEVQKHLFYAKARRFSSCLEAALFPHQISPLVYKNLIQTVRHHLSALHEYMALRKQILGYSELHLYDLSTPLIPDVDLSIDYPQGEKLVIESVQPLGEKYQQILSQGLLKDRWVDRYENARKRSGAYSSGCYDSMPYILMNYQGKLRDVMTLAHEAGHSMHSFLSWKHQAYQNASYPIFVAEVASTFNEELVLKTLLSKTSEKNKKAFLINQKIDDMRSTFFRQTMFAEFELKIHEFAEQGVPITPALLKSEYLKLNIDYFGPSVVVDPEIEMEWARIPHFYYNFYVYQYSTGIAASYSLMKVVEEKGADNYLKFLSSGGSDYPLELLRIAGVDMEKPHAILSFIDYFRKLTQELKKLCMN